MQRISIDTPSLTLGANRESAATVDGDVALVSIFAHEQEIR